MVTFFQLTNITMKAREITLSKQTRKQFFLNNQKKQVSIVDATTKFQTYVCPSQINLSSTLVTTCWNPLIASPSSKVSLT